MNARGMPDVSISQTTQDALTVEAESRVKKGNEEMFENPNVKLEIKPTTEITPMDRNGIEQGQEGFEAPPAVKPKKKRKMTQAQLDALARGRETSMKNRMGKAKEKKAVKAEASVKVEPQQAPKKVKFEYQEPPPLQTLPQTPYAQQQHYNQQQQMYQQPQIDYDKIISGVANMYQQREQQKVDKRNHEEQVNTDVAKFEAQIREDERVKLMVEFEKKEKEKLKSKALKTTQNVLQRQPPSVDNPYAYAFQMNSRNNFKRY